MKTAASYIKNKYDCYKGYSEESIREVCHIWCEVIEEAQNDVKKEYEEKLRWIPIEEKLPENRERVLVKVLRSDKSTIIVTGSVFLDSKLGIYWQSGHATQLNVTHWLSLSFFYNAT